MITAMVRIAFSDDSPYFGDIYVFEGTPFIQTLEGIHIGETGKSCFFPGAKLVGPSKGTIEKNSN